MMLRGLLESGGWGWQQAFAAAAVKMTQPGHFAGGWWRVRQSAAIQMTQQHH